MTRLDISKLKKNRPIYLKVGLIISLSFALFAFNYTIYDIEPEMELVEIDEVNFDDIPVIRTPRERKPIPIPPAIEISDKIEEIEEEEFIEEPEPDILPTDVVVDEPVDVPVITRPAAPKPKKPVVVPDDPAEDLVDPTIYTRVERMPEFGDIDPSITEKERRQLSDKNLLSFIYKNIKYPTLALENGYSGKVFVRFVVNEQGVVQDAEILREPGGGLGKEVLRVIGKMPTWKPGKQGMRNVKVMFTLPVEFSAR